ncbi:MAG: FitA-like ribbon-helix-helix domain-containing protein [Acidimicrobiia bacterium]
MQQSGELCTLIHMDDPDHRRYRAITADWFQPRSLARLEARLAELARGSRQNLLPITECPPQCFTFCYTCDVPDLNVRNVPDVVLERLRQQALAEGVSLSEWVRSALSDRAELPTTSEIMARRRARREDARPAEEFDAFYRRRLHRRST